MRPPPRSGPPPLRRVLLRRRSGLVGGRLVEWERAGLDVYAYFNNDGGGHAVHNATSLATRLERGRHEPVH